MFQLLMKNRLFVLAAYGFGILPAKAAMVSGEVVLVDFGLTVPGSGHYNVIHSGQLSISSLVESTGNPVDVGLVVTATHPFDNLSNVPSTTEIAHLNTEDEEVYEDGFLSANGSNGAGTDVITLTFTGLDEQLEYGLSAGLSRSSGGSNFSTTWKIDGEPLKVSDGSPANGHVSFTGLRPNQGALVVTLTDNVRQTGLAQLVLTAVEPTPATPPEIDLPRILDLTKQGDEQWQMKLDREGKDFVLQQSDDLEVFSTVDYTLDESDRTTLRLEGSENVDPDGDGRSFFRAARQPNFIIILTDDQG
ncbi:MAG: hypothetical protein ACQKBU_12490, partial [Verrucomicrobiales bacterium]